MELRCFFVSTFGRNHKNFFASSFHDALHGCFGPRPAFLAEHIKGKLHTNSRPHRFNSRALSDRHRNICRKYHRRCVWLTIPICYEHAGEDTMGIRSTRSQELRADGFAPIFLQRSHCMIFASATELTGAKRWKQ